MGTVDSIIATLPLLWDGALVTLQICALAMVAATILGIVLVSAHRSRRKALRIAAMGYTSIIRGLPIVILVFLLYFGVPALLGLGRVSAFWVGVIALGLNGGAFVGEILRAALARIPKGQWEGAKALGLSRIKTWRLVITPQLLPIALPALVGEFGFLVKASPALALVTVVDLTRRAQQVSMETFDPLTPMLAAALLYFIMLFGIAQAAAVLERRAERWRRTA